MAYNDFVYEIDSKGGSPLNTRRILSAAFAALVLLPSDLGYVYSWGNLTSTICSLVQSNRPNIASTMKAVEKLFKNNVNKILDAIGAGA